MKAVCPKNKKHNRFITCVRVEQEWEVDSKGIWIRTVDENIETTHGPHPLNTWICSVCGAVAKVE